MALLIKWNFLFSLFLSGRLIILLILGDPGAVYQGGTNFPFVLPPDLRGWLPVRTLPKDTAQLLGYCTVHFVVKRPLQLCLTRRHFFFERLLKDYNNCTVLGTVLRKTAVQGIIFLYFHRRHVTSVMYIFSREIRCRVTNDRWDFVWEIKYWGLRTLKIIFNLLKKSVVTAWISHPIPSTRILLSATERSIRRVEEMSRNVWNSG